MLIGKGLKTYNDTYFLYKRIKNNTVKIIHDIKPSIKFKAKDYVDLSKNSQETQDNALRLYDYLTIETNANIVNFEPMDKVVNAKGKEYLIEDIIANDNNTMKQYSSNPSVKTIIKLKGAN